MLLFFSGITFTFKGAFAGPPRAEHVRIAQEESDKLPPSGLRGVTSTLQSMELMD